MKTIILSFMLNLAGCPAHAVDLHLGTTTEEETLTRCPGAHLDETEVEGIDVLRWDAGSSWIRLSFDREGRLYGANMHLITGDKFPFTVQGIGVGTTETELRTRFGAPKIEFDDGGHWNHAGFTVTFSAGPDTTGILIGPPLPRP